MRQPRSRQRTAAERELARVLGDDASVQLDSPAFKASIARLRHRCLRNLENTSPSDFDGMSAEVAKLHALRSLISDLQTMERDGVTARAEEERIKQAEDLRRRTVPVAEPQSPSIPTTLPDGFLQQ